MTSTLIITHLLLSISLLFTLSYSDPSSRVQPSDACRSTPDQDYCNLVLSSKQNSSDTLYNYSRFSLSKSLSDTEKFFKLIDNHLRTNNSSFPPAAISALKDCQLLYALNIQFLNLVKTTLNNTNSNLMDSNAETLQTLLSALITNHQTCSDGISENGITLPSFSNCPKLYSVSLALYTKAWNPNRSKPPSHNGFVASRLPKNPNFHLMRPGGRKLLQAVLVYDMVVVNKNGGWNYNTISAAVAAAPKYLDGSKGYFLIYVMAGVYEEYISIPGDKTYLMIIGDGIGQTVITGNRNAGPLWSTFSSATFAVGGQGFVGYGLTIRNTAGAINGQAVALRNTADLSSFYECSIEGYQDTLYAHSMRQFYRGCDIYGTIDFIFGNAAAVFQSCNIYARIPLSGQANTITAQSRSDPNQNTGFSLQGCQFKAGPDLSALGLSRVKTFLGRPWKPYSRVVVMQSFLDGVIDQAGWSVWSIFDNLSHLYYAEYANWGTGAWFGNRVTWPGFHLIESRDASNFTVSGFILGDAWLPQTGVPYNSGFI